MRTIELAAMSARSWFDVLPDGAMPSTIADAPELRAVNWRRPSSKAVCACADDASLNGDDGCGDHASQKFA